MLSSEDRTRYADHFVRMEGDMPVFDFSDEWNSEWLRSPESAAREETDWEAVDSGDSGGTETLGAGTAPSG